VRHPSGDPSQPLNDQQDAARLLPARPGADKVPELPERYGRPCLTLMVKDPLSLFAYWELTPELSPAPDTLWLAVYEAAAPHEPWRPLGERYPVSDVGRYHLRVPHGGRRYVARLENSAGEKLIESNVVLTPPEGPSEESAAPWLGQGLLSDWLHTVPGGPFSPGFEKAGRARWLTVGAGSSPMQDGGRPPLLAELSAQLIVRGKASPGSRIIAQGKLVPVAPDGTFTIEAQLAGDDLVLAIRLEDEGTGKGWESSLIAVERRPWTPVG